MDDKHRNVQTLNSDKDWERAWEYHKQLDAVLTWRIGYLVIAQAAMMAGVAALIASERDGQTARLAAYAMCVLGIAFVLVQWVMSSRVVKKLSYLRDQYLVPLCPMYRLDTPAALAPSEGIQAVGLPIALWVIWVILFELALLPK